MKQHLLVTDDIIDIIIIIGQPKIHVDSFYVTFTLLDHIFLIVHLQVPCTTIFFKIHFLTHTKLHFLKGVDLVIRQCL